MTDEPLPNQPLGGGTGHLSKDIIFAGHPVSLLPFLSKKNAKVQKNIDGQSKPTMEKTPPSSIRSEDDARPEGDLVVEFVPRVHLDLHLSGKIELKPLQMHEHNCRGKQPMRQFFPTCKETENHREPLCREFLGIAKEFIFEKSSKKKCQTQCAPKSLVWFSSYMFQTTHSKIARFVLKPHPHLTDRKFSQSPAPNNPPTGGLHLTKYLGYVRARLLFKNQLGIEQATGKKTLAGPLPLGIIDWGGEPFGTARKE